MAHIFFRAFRLYLPGHTQEGLKSTKNAPLYRCCRLTAAGNKAALPRHELQRISALQKWTLTGFTPNGQRKHRNPEPPRAKTIARCKGASETPPQVGTAHTNNRTRPSQCATPSLTQWHAIGAGRGDRARRPYGLTRASV